MGKVRAVTDGAESGYGVDRKRSRKHRTGTVNESEGAERVSRASPTLPAASLTCLQSPVTSRSIAALTLFEIRFLATATSVAGSSRAASARLAGAGGVTFSILVFLRLSLTRQRAKRHVLNSPSTTLGRLLMSPGSEGCDARADRHQRTGSPAWLRKH